MVEQRNLIVPVVEVSGLLKINDFHLVQSLDICLIEMNALSLNYWLQSKFVAEGSEAFL